MFMERLETRRLMCSTAINTTIVADRAAVFGALSQFETDIANGITTLNADCKALKADDVGGDATLAPLIKQFHTDANAMDRQLAADVLVEKQNVLNDQKTIVGELLQFVADKGNPTARAADKAALLTDRVQLENDEIAGLNSRINTRKTDYTELGIDLEAIQTALGNDTNASTQLTADVNQFVNDRINIFQTLFSDLTTIKDDRTKLATDLTALETVT